MHVKVAYDNSKINEDMMMMMSWLLVDYFKLPQSIISLVDYTAE